MSTSQSPNAASARSPVPLVSDHSDVGNFNIVPSEVYRSRRFGYTED